MRQRSTRRYRPRRDTAFYPIILDNYEEYIDRRFRQELQSDSRRQRLLDEHRNVSVLCILQILLLVN